MTAAVAALDMPAEGCGAAQPDRSHRVALHGGKRRALNGHSPTRPSDQSEP
jgi:hypothetical protein